MAVVRRVQADEWRIYRDVRLRALQESPDAFGSTYEVEVARPDDAWSSRLLAASTSGKDLPLFAIDAGAVCGLVWCKLSATDPARAEVFQMWVSPASRGAGIGAALLDEVIAYARHAGVRWLSLGVTVAESPAMRLYRSRGFVPVGDPEPLRPGSTHLAQTLRLELDAP